MRVIAIMLVQNKVGTVAGNQTIICILHHTIFSLFLILINNRSTYTYCSY